MTEYKFDPPLTLAGNIVVVTLEDAAAFVRGYKVSKRPVMQDGVLRRLERADSEHQQNEAAAAFRGWAEAEGILVRSGPLEAATTPLLVCYGSAVDQPPRGGEAPVLADATRMPLKTIAPCPPQHLRHEQAGASTRPEYEKEFAWKISRSGVKTRTVVGLFLTALAGDIGRFRTIQVLAKDLPAGLR
jgi:hypothetical protein